MKRSLDDFPKERSTDEVSVPDFWSKVFEDGDEVLPEGRVEGESSAVENLILTLSEEEDDLDIEVFPADLWRSELEAFRILSKKRLKNIEDLYQKEPSNLNRAKFEFEKAKYAFYLHVVLEEFVPLYNKFSALLKSGNGTTSEGFTLSDLELEMEKLCFLALERDSESRELVLKLAKKILSMEKRIELERENYSNANLSLLQNIEDLEKKILELSEANLRLFDLNQAKVLISESDGDRLLSGDFSEIGVLKKELNSARSEVSRLKEKLSGFELQLALFDKVSRMNVQEFSELRERAENGDRAVKRLNEELANFERTFGDYVRLQADFNAIRDQLENYLEENEALKEQITHKDLEISSFRQFGQSGVSQEEYVSLQNERRELRFKCADQEKQIQNLSAQLSELEKVGILRIPAILKEIADRINSVGFGVEKVYSIVSGEQIDGTPTAGVLSLSEED
ncbi:MAG: hypothetical protein RBS56_01555 [Candidatus Gracilibacteria bacterium]|jgi:predicted transcriptional regulator|nr:hypothetical protein [Candidatus Gracilibacteria bacterium]